MERELVTGYMYQNGGLFAHILLYCCTPLSVCLSPNFVFATPPYTQEKEIISSEKKISSLLLKPLKGGGWGWRGVLMKLGTKKNYNVSMFKSLGL
jgi:hypothetical protein